MIQAINDAMNRQRPSTQTSTTNPDGNRWHRMLILESKSMMDIGQMQDGKTYRILNRKMKNALDQIRPNTRSALEHLETITEQSVNEQALLNPRNRIAEVIIELFEIKVPNVLDHGMTREILEEVNRDLWSIINAKAVDKSEAMGKIKAIHQGEGLWACIRIHQWLSKTTDQGKNNRRMMVMMPEPCARTMQARL